MFINQKLLEEKENMKISACSICFFLSIMIISVAGVYAKEKPIVETLTLYEVEVENRMACGSHVTLHFNARQSVKDPAAVMLMICLSKEDIVNLLDEQNYAPVKNFKDITGYHFVKGRGPVTKKLFKKVIEGRRTFERLIKK